MSSLSLPSFLHPSLPLSPSRTALSPPLLCQSPLPAPHAPRNLHLNPRRTPRVRHLPLSSIQRPLRHTRANDAQKVRTLMASIADDGVRVPVDVLEVAGSFYGFSGCHRFEACERLGLELIPCRVYGATEEVLRRHLA